MMLKLEVNCVTENKDGGEGGEVVGDKSNIENEDLEEEWRMEQREMGIRG